MCGGEIKADGSLNKVSKTPEFQEFASSSQLKEEEDEEDFFSSEEEYEEEDSDNLTEDEGEDQSMDYFRRSLSFGKQSPALEKRIRLKRRTSKNRSTSNLNSPLLRKNGSKYSQMTPQLMRTVSSNSGKIRMRKMFGNYSPIMRRSKSLKKSPIVMRQALSKKFTFGIELKPIREEKQVFNEELTVEDEETGKLVKEEDREYGIISWTVYLYYLKNGGLCRVFFVVLAFLVSSIVELAAVWWVSQWANNRFSFSSTTYFVIYTSLIIASFVLMLLKYSIFSSACQKIEFQDIQRPILEHPSASNVVLRHHQLWDDTKQVCG